ncbi:unnamed protein product [Symbiodinium sp. KB8]|nr:unnamed protein product [Symbiodinium sp. KB8]
MGARGSSCCDRMEVIPTETVRAGAIPGEATGPPEVKEEPSLELEPRQVSFHWGQRLARLEAMKVLEVDREIIRSISLSSSLKRFGLLWQRVHMPFKVALELTGADRSKLWEKSEPSDHFDVFLSHTWRTSGRWKVLSLLFQYCWPIVMVSWLCVVAVAFLLSCLGALPMPLVFKINVLGFQAACPAAPWTLLSGSLAVPISLLLSPYILCNSPKCFLDVVSIHQTDSELMERGVHGLGGFLSVSQELRVLWSPPYLTRLWCVFEIGAFRKANPKGRLSLMPLFVERQVFLTILGNNAAAGMMCAIFASDLDVRFSIPLSFLAVSPILFIVHGLRIFMREKHQLIAALKDFRLEDAGYSLEHDREFVHTAITAWYSSPEAFSDYVRGPLCQELTGMIATRLPLSYGMLCMTGPLGIGLDVLAALIHGGAPIESALSEFLGSWFGYVLFGNLLVFNAMWRLCDRYAAKSGSTVLDFGKSILLFICFFVMFFADFALTDLLYTTTLWGGIAFAVASLPLVLLVYGKCSWTAWARPD